MIAALLAEEVVHDQKTASHQQTGDHAGDEQFRDRDRLENTEFLDGLRRRLQTESGDAENDHRNRGWNDDAEAAGGGGNGRGVAPVIAVVDHGRDHQEAHGGGGCGAGAGDRAEEKAGKDGRGADAAGEGAGEALGERHQAFRDTGGLHQGAGQDEGGQRHQRKGTDRGERDLHELDRVLAEIKEGSERGDAERHRDGRSDQEQDEKGAEQNVDDGAFHDLVSPRA